MKFGKFAQAFAWSSVANYTSFFFSMGIRLYLARSLEAADFGLYATATATIDVLQVLGTARFNLSLIQYRQSSQIELKVLRLVQGQAVASLLLGLSIAGYAMRSGREPLAWLMAAYVLSQCINFLKAYYQTILERDLLFRPVGLATMASTAIAGVAVVASATYYPGSWVLAIRDLAVAVVTAAGLWWATRRLVKCPMQSEGGGESTYRQLLSTGGLYIVQTQGINIADRADVLLLAYAYSQSVVGQYSQAKWLTVTAANVLVLGMGFVYPMYAKVTNAPERRDALFLMVNMIFGRAAVAIGVGFILLPDLVAQVVLGGGWSQAAGLLPAMSVGVVGQVLFANANYLAIANGHLRAAAATAWLRAASVVGLGWCAYQDSPKALAWVFALGTLVGVILIGLVGDSLYRRIYPDAVVTLVYVGWAMLLVALRPRGGVPYMLLAVLGVALVLVDGFRMLQAVRRFRGLEYSPSAQGG